jgi:hypothetical protein
VLILPPSLCEGGLIPLHMRGGLVYLPKINHPLLNYQIACTVVRKKNPIPLRRTGSNYIVFINKLSYNGLCPVLNG